MIYGGIVRDDAGALREAVARALAEHDALVLSGGSSVGTKDVTAEAMLDLPAPGVLFHGIDIQKPGKPTLFARAGHKPVVGMPGFPTSSLIVFDAFIRPMLWRLGGETAREPWPARRAARLAKAQPSVVGREDYVRVRLVTRRAATSVRRGPSPSQDLARPRSPTSSSPTGSFCIDGLGAQAWRPAIPSRSSSTELAGSGSLPLANPGPPRSAWQSRRLTLLILPRPAKWGRRGGGRQ